jgi:hypothetical protein
VSDDLQLHRLTPILKGDLPWENLQAIELARFRRVLLRAAGDPTQQELMFPRVLFEPLLALVFHLRGRLQREQAFQRLLQVDPRLALIPIRVLREFLVVRLKVVAEEGKLETPLPGKRAMTFPTAAPGPAQERDHVPAETRLRIGFCRIASVDSARNRQEQRGDPKTNLRDAPYFHGR